MDSPDSLEVICLDNIALNIKLNYEKCKKLSLKIPWKLGEKIYKNSFTILETLTDIHLKFFSKEIMDLKNINLSKKQYTTIEYFDFLNGHKLENLFVSGVEKFKLNSTDNFLIITENFHFVYTHFIDENFEYLKYFLNNCLVTKSVTLNTKNTLFFTSVQKSDLFFVKLGESIEIIDLINFHLDFNGFKLLMISIKGKKMLKKLCLNLRLITGKKIDWKDMIYHFDFLPKTLRSLQVDVEQDQNEIFIYLPKLLKEMTKLSEFQLTTMPIVDLLSIQIVKSLEIYHSKNLISLELFFQRISEKNIIYLAKLISKCNFLKELRINGIFKVKSFLGYTIFDSIHSCVENLNIFEISVLDKSMSWKNFESLLPKFSSLLIVDIFDYISEESDVECFKKFFESIKGKLKELSISFDQSTKFLTDKLSFENFHQLHEIWIYSLNFKETSISRLCSELKKGICGEVLKSFGISSSKLDENTAKDIKQLFISCINLESITFQHITSASSVFSYIIDGLYSSTKSLVSIDITGCEFDDCQGNKLASLFTNCKSIKSLSLTYNPLTTDAAYNILNSLKKSRKALEMCSFYCQKGVATTHEDVEILAKSFYNLSEFTFY